MKAYAQFSRSELEQEYRLLTQAFEAVKARGLSLDMSRGKPSKAQLDETSGILTVLSDAKDCFEDGIDSRNYGNLSGLPSAKKLFAELLGCRPEECFIGGSASLTLMYDLIAKAYTHGLKDSPRPWCREESLKWICPAPGYDRHFKITESFGFEMIPVPMKEDGPDMDLVEQLAQDPAVKGIWCVPKYSNPDGIIYSEETCRRLASMQTAAPDFALMWDNAYCVHEFVGDYVEFPDILSLCREAGHPDRVYEFASTSKITFPGAGISVMAASRANLDYLEKLLGVQMISYDKVNQLRHVRYLKDKATTLALMKRHAALLAPKFACVEETLRKEIGGLGIARWQEPKGGYFVSLYTLPGLARRTLALAKEAGVTMTGAGATYPLGKDPEDSNIRIAPSLPPVSELEAAMEIFCLALRLAAVEKYLQ